MAMLMVLDRAPEPTPLRAAFERAVAFDELQAAVGSKPSRHAAPRRRAPARARGLHRKVT
jgi:hypothetical protein